MKKSIEVLLIAGTRPNFMKVAPLFHAFTRNERITPFLCHTGQHFDTKMSDSFWTMLDLPDPHYKLNVQGKTVSTTIGKTINALDELFAKKRFDLVVVVGDVNATIAGAITTCQNGMKLMHVESGLRSNDRSMPEELNRIITDHVSDFLMVSERSGIDNLNREGIPEEKIHFVGNIMIECLLNTQEKWSKIHLPQLTNSTKKLCTVTFHRPENVDRQQPLERIIKVLLELSQEYQVVFPIHPRTNAQLEKYKLYEKLNDGDIVKTGPMPYFDFLKLISTSDLVVTDSGGIQEETTFLNVPCVTLRNNTERPVTITQGTNQLLSISDNSVVKKIHDHRSAQEQSEKTSIELWDNQVSSRIAQVITQTF